MLFQSIPSRRGPEGLPGRHDCEGAARRLGVTGPNLSRKLNGRAGVSAVMSVRLAKAMPYTSPEFWLKLQLNYDLWKAQESRQPKIKPFPARPQSVLILAKGSPAIDGMMEAACQQSQLRA